jgi:uncharacterized protein YdaU (DUF1376 family)
MAELPVLPVITAALIADTVHMSAEQFGAYVRILMAMWGNGAELRDNNTELARIAGVSLSRWKTIREVVLGPVTSIDGKLFQKRLSETWDEVQRLRVKRTAASNERWHRERLRNAHAHPNGHARGYASADAYGHASAMQLECNKKEKDKLTSTFVGTAREGSAMQPVEKSQITNADGLAEVIAKKGWAQS